MRRKVYQEEPENHDRWLVSYADFITLLFAFFVVMYAISSVNQGKYRVLSSSLGNAFGNAPVAQAKNEDATVPSFTLRQSAALKQRSEQLRREKDHMKNMARSVLTALAPLIDQGKVRVTQSANGVTIEINASVLFAPGEAQLAAKSGDSLKAVAAVLQADTHNIQVEGHTDNVPIKNPSFASNWDLSAIRASSVVRLLEENGIAESRLSVAGYGDTRPLDSNETVEGRARNRRVTITILSGLSERQTEVPITP